MSPRKILAVLMLVLAGGMTAEAQDAQSDNTGPTTRPLQAGSPMPRAALEGMYRSELGNLFAPQLAGKLYEVHQLLEQFFAAKSAQQRQQAVKQLEASGVDVNIAGRLARLRMNWGEVPAGVYAVDEKVGPYPVKYYVGVPAAYDRRKPWPLIVKLANATAFPGDPPPTPEELPRFYGSWISSDLNRHPDAIVLMPELDPREGWGPGYKGMNNVIQPLLHVGERLNIDPAGVYLIGHGQSGFATWNLAIHHPTYFAAINPMAAGAAAPFQKIRWVNLMNIYSVVWHGAEDTAVKVDASREIVRYLRARKFGVDYEETEKAGHAPTAEIIARLQQKLRAVRRPLYPRQVVIASNRPDAHYNRADWLHVYQQRRLGKEQQVVGTYGSAMMRFYQYSYEAAAMLAGDNRIEVKTDNVDTLRLYLNDQMVDFSRPVTVLVNGKVRFEKPVKPSMEEMLQDQLFLGRGWRYFAGIIDLDAPPETSPTTRPTTRRAVEGTR